MLNPLDNLRDPDGSLPSYAWPGGYPLTYTMADCATLCPDCANGKNGSDASVDSTDPQWQIIDASIYWEGADLYCDHCSKSIASAYGDPDND